MCDMAVLTVGSASGSPTGHVNGDESLLVLDPGDSVSSVM
jgi:hypothetical protein